jgi:hypothetical protein
MTVSVSQAVIDATDLVMKRGAGAAQMRARILRVLPPIVAFAAAALAGAFGIAHLAYASIVAPMLVLIALVPITLAGPKTVTT